MVEILDSDFVVRHSGDAFAAYDKAHADKSIPDMPDGVVEAYSAAIELVLVERPSPALVAEAIARKLENEGDVVKDAAWWLASSLSAGAAT